MSDLYEHMYGSLPDHVADIPEFRSIRTKEGEMKAVPETDKEAELEMREKAVAQAEEYIKKRAAELEAQAQQSASDDGRTPREHIIAEAQKITTGDRNKAYGDPADNHKKIAAMWNTYTMLRMSGDGWQGEFDAEDVAMMQVLLKVVRIAYRSQGVDHGDSFVDLVGYGAIAGECRRMNKK